MQVVTDMVAMEDAVKVQQVSGEMELPIVLVLVELNLQAGQIAGVVAHALDLME